MPGRFVHSFHGKNSLKGSVREKMKRVIGIRRKLSAFDGY